MRHTESGAIRRVPILGHIPVLNLAFRKKDKHHQTAELIAFILPTVLRTTEADGAAKDAIVDNLEIICEWEEEGRVKTIVELQSDSK